MISHIIRVFYVLCGVLLTAGVAQAEAVKVGVTGGPHAQIMEQVAKLAAKDGLEIKIVEFDDYQLSNAALAGGDLDANSFQHQPFLDNQVTDRGYAITSIAKPLLFPIGIYSKKIKSLAELKDGDKVGIPNNPTNGGRVLLLLQAQGSDPRFVPTPDSRLIPSTSPTIRKADLAAQLHQAELLPGCAMDQGGGGGGGGGPGVPVQCPSPTTASWPSW